MFTCSRVETENLFYKPTKRSPSNKSNLSSNCNNNFNNIFTTVPENDQQRVKYHEASLKRNQLKQELQRRHQLCAEKERLCRERAEKQTALKKAEECNALRKFYELKSAQLKRSNSLPTSSNNSSSSSNSSLSSTFSSSSKKSFPSRSMSTTIKQFQSAYKIHSFIKHYIEKRNTQRIISYLIKLRSIQNQVTFLKSIKLKGNLTFDLNNKNQVLPISCNNKAFLIYKESLLKILNQLNEFTDELYLVRERKLLINNTVNNMLKELENVKDLQYKKFIENNNKVDEDFVIINE